MKEKKKNKSAKKYDNEKYANNDFFFSLVSKIYVNVTIFARANLIERIEEFLVFADTLKISWLPPPPPHVINNNQEFHT